ncbi:MAG TPA: O-antigen ligase domain-containing protein [Flavobacteriales bacterium]|nr:O-antigen ligase domain-containing protein [Flavobacteriales bacterium]
MKSSKYLNYSGIYMFGLLVLAVGLPLSNFLMSIGQVVVGIAWLMEGGYKRRLQGLLSNKGVLIFLSIFFLHILGLLYSTDYTYAFNDLRIKLPLLVLPFLIATSEKIKKKNLAYIMLVFSGAVLIGTLVSVGELIGINNWFRSFAGIPENVILDVRYISLYISHIRFSLMICLSIFWLIFSVSDNSIPFKLSKWLFLLVALWLLLFLFLLESITGLGIMIIAGFIWLVYRAIAIKNIKKRIISLLGISLLPVVLMLYMVNLIEGFYHVEPEQIENLDQKTADGYVYFHDKENRQMENGKRVWIYICKEELEPAWNKRSSLAFSGKDRKGQHLEYTLLRFMTSKGLRKDSVSLQKLTDFEIEMVENGIANIRFATTSSIEAKLYGVIWEMDSYYHGGSPGGHSVVQRWEYWKTAFHVIRQNWLIGVGTGDVLNKMYVAYENSQTIMEEKYWKRPHNQFLSIGVAFGVMGMLWFLACMLIPVRYYPDNADKLFFVFLLIALLSMLTEDTLETQAGATFVSYFYALLLFGRSADR